MKRNHLEKEKEEEEEDLSTSLYILPRRLAIGLLVVFSHLALEIGKIQNELGLYHIQGASISPSIAGRTRAR